MIFRFASFVLVMVFLSGCTEKNVEIINNNGKGFLKGKYYQICNISTTSINPTECWEGFPGMDWRVSWWNQTKGTYNRFGEPSQNGGRNDPPLMERGVGYWFVSSAGADSISFPGISSTDNPAPIELNLSDDGNPAYTMIGNPFRKWWKYNAITLTAEGNPKESISIAASKGRVVNNLSVWNGSEYSDNYSFTSDIEIHPGQAGWISTTMTKEQANEFYGSPNIKLQIENSGIVDKKTHWSKPERGKEELSAEWDLQLIVSSIDGEYLHQNNKLGIRENGTELYDPHDVNELTPPTSSYVQLYFTHPEYEISPGNLTRDMRSMDFDGPKIWNFTVKTVGIPNKSFTLTWKGIEDIPMKYTLTFSNVDNTEIIGDMREVKQVSIQSGDESIQEFHYRVSCVYASE